MTKPCKYDNIPGFAGEKDLKLLEKGAELFKSITRGLWHNSAEILQSKARSQLPKYDP